ncbi:MAG TPA: hypothetical protein DCM86_19415 [Verrucomicrobiales bacterium]|nr:hypothetical protein [Verrucomicrobiales bacterium]
MPKINRFFKAAAAAACAVASILTGFGAEDPSLPPPPLTPIAEIRQLAPSEVESHPEVRVRGVVTYANEASGSLYLQDASGGIYVWPKNRPTAVKPGSEVEIDGTIQAGELATAIRPSTNGFRVTGTGSLPQPRVPGARELAEGAVDGQYIECQGVVQGVDQGFFHWRVDLWTGLSRIRCLLPADATLAPDRLLDAVVRVRGVVVGTRPSDSQALQLALHVNNAADLEIATPSANDPFAAAPVTIHDLMRLGPVSLGGHRVRLSGLVSLTRTNGDFYIEDSGGGVLVRPAAPVKLAVGDRVEVVGFPSPAEARPVLESVVTRPAPATTAARSLPEPPAPTLAPLPEPAPSSPSDGRFGWPVWALLVCVGGFGACIYVLVTHQAELRRENKKLVTAAAESGTRVGRLQRSAEVERARATQQELLVKLAGSRTLEDRGLDAAVQEILEATLEVLRASHAGVWVRAEEGTDRLEERWCRPRPMESRPPRTAEPEWMAWSVHALREQKTVAITEIQTDPLTASIPAAHWHSRDVSSVIDGALACHGEAAGILRHEHEGPAREWTRAEQEFAAAAAAILSRLLQRSELATLAARSREQLAVQQGLASWGLLLIETPPDQRLAAGLKLLESAARMAESDLAEFGLINPAEPSIRWFSRPASQPAEPTLPGLEGRNEELHPSGRAWLWERLLRGESVVISNRENLPPEASGERQALEDRGCRAAVYLPVIQGSRTTGIIACFRLGEEHAWPDSILSPLQAAGRLLTAALSPEPRIAARDRIRTLAT